MRKEFQDVIDGRDAEKLETLLLRLGKEIPLFLVNWNPRYKYKTNYPGVDLTEATKDIGHLWSSDTLEMLINVKLAPDSEIEIKQDPETKKRGRVIKKIPGASEPDDDIKAQLQSENPEDILIAADTLLERALDF